MGKYSKRRLKWRKISSILLILFPIFSLGIAKAETIKIVSDTAYAPFEFKDSDQTYKGIDVDISTKSLRLKDGIFRCPIPGFDAAVNAVQSWSSWRYHGRDDKDEKNVKKSSPCLILTMIQKLSLQLQRHTKLAKYDQLTGKTVGVKTELPLNVSLKQSKINTALLLKTFDTSDLMNNSLSAGAIDAMMDDNACYRICHQPRSRPPYWNGWWSCEEFCFRCEKGSKYEHLVTEFNQALAEMKKDGSLDKIIKEMDCFVSSSVPTTTTTAGLKATPVKAKYIIASDSSFCTFCVPKLKQPLTGYWYGLD